jgi:release factor glutamine methyltransferase
LECHIDLSFKPLIPRPETEYWVGNILHSHLQQVPFRFNRGETRINVLDLCCGSGCIGIAVLKHLKNVSVDFADTDKNALAQTTLNLKLNREDQDFAQDFSNAYRVVKSNLFQNLKGKKYNYIFCNPPYVNKNKAFDKSLKFEPKDALFAKDEGLFLIKEILRDFNKYLLPNGKMYLEFGFRQKPKIESYLKQLGINKYLFNKDQYKRWRWVELKLNIAPTG